MEIKIATASSATQGPAWPLPRANTVLVGHESAERVLLEAAIAARLAHAWLITGIGGIGKATLAFRFARFLLAGGDGRDGAGGLFASPATSLDLDAGSPVFRRIVSGGHADLLTVERVFDDKRDRLRREIVVDDVRAIGAFLAQTPAEGGWRIVVIDSADALNRSAANALLKILEEPPERALLLLTSEAPGRLLATIRSRCRRLALHPLPEASVMTLLRRYRPDLAEAELKSIAAISEGSIGRALGLAEAGVVELHGDLEHFLATLPSVDVAALHRLCDKALKQGDDGFAAFAGLVRRLLASLVRVAGGGAGQGGVEPTLEALARMAPLDRWLEVWEKSTRLLAVVDSANLDRKQVLLSVLLDIAVVVRR